MAVAAFRVDASAASGAGHWTRCLALGGALADIGVDVNFVTAATDAPDEAALAANGVRWLRLGKEATSDEVADAMSTQTALGVAPDWLVLDHYRLGNTWEAAARVDGTRLLAFEDQPNRRHTCDALLDPNLSGDGGAEPDPYAGLVPPSCRRLYGPRYALLRPQFARRRRTIRRTSGAVRRVLVFFGSADSQGWSLLGAQAARRAFPQAQVDVVVGGSSPHRAKLSEAFGQDAAIHLHVQTPCMEELMASADLALGAAGSATWERCCLGLPAVLVVVQENQRGVASTVSRRGAASVVDGSAQSVEEALRALGGDEQARIQMSERGMRLVDGAGIRRVRDLLFPLTVRPASGTDMDLLWTWANDPEVRRNAIQQRPILLEDHERWFHARLQDPGCRIYVGEVAGKSIGQVRFERDGDAVVIDISLSAPFRGMGLGTAMLKAAIAAHAERRRPLSLRAYVKPDNAASREMFLACGFQAAGPDSRGLHQFSLSYANAHADG